jgi:hypothetical protein
MPDLVSSALAAPRESRRIEFKQGFDPASPGEWCELIKDIVALANSGGGIIVFGLDSRGTPTMTPVKSVLAVDPADLTNRIFRYTGCVDFDVEIRELQKGSSSLAGFIIPAAPTPLAFEKPGTYDIGGGKQKAAFGVGTVYFRHGSKSEPATTDDFRSVAGRIADHVRREWARGIRKVVSAPAGSQVVMVQRTGPERRSPHGRIRLSDNPDAVPVILTRDPNRTDGVFIHEEISDGIFDEINNVVDANRALAKGQRRFMLGPNLYYRIYAERQHVHDASKQSSLLAHAAVAEMYAPSLYWIGYMPDQEAAAAYSELFLNPKSPQIHALVRMSILLGQEFCGWLLGKWKRKWAKHPQPPSFYFTFQQMCDEASGADFRAVAARLSPVKIVQCRGEQPITVAELLKNEATASALLSRACILVFEGRREERSIARDLDYIAYGRLVRGRAKGLSEAIISTVGHREPGDFADAATA